MLYEMSMAPLVLMLFNSIYLNKASLLLNYSFHTSLTVVQLTLQNCYITVFRFFLFFFCRSFQQCPKCEILMLQSEQTTKNAVWDLKKQKNKKKKATLYWVVYSQVNPRLRKLFHQNYKVKNSSTNIFLVDTDINVEKLKILIMIW